VIVTFEEYTPNITPDEIIISKQIGTRIREFHKTKRNAVTSSRIIKAYKKRGSHITERQIRKMINHLRNNGVPIAACGKGYFWPVTISEISDYRNSLLQRIGEIIRVYNKIGPQLHPDFKSITLSHNE
jgi:hypothetical protein